MKENLRGILAVILVAGVLMPGTAVAAKGWITNAKIIRTLVQHDRFGICMIKLSKANNNLSCSDWVTFDCGGELEGNTRTAANLKFNTAQLAMATGNRVRVFLDDDIKINGQCFASRFEQYTRD